MDAREEFSYGQTFSIRYRQGRQIYDMIMKDMSLSGRQVWYIQEIHRNPGISQEEISRKYQIDKGSVSRAVKMLSDSGMVEVAKNPDDRRGNRLFLTDKAEKLQEKCCRYMDHVESSIERGMSDEEKAAFRSSLIRVTENMERLIKEGRTL